VTRKGKNTNLSSVQHLLTIILALPGLQDRPLPSYALLPAPQALATKEAQGPALPPDGLPLWSPRQDPLPLPNRPAMPIEDWRRWIEEHAASTHRGLRLRSTGQGVLVQGPPDEVASLREFGQQVQQLIEALQIEIQVTVQVGQDDPARQFGWLPSGGHLALGEVQQRGFVGSWRSEIAADSAVAEPELWTAQTGWALFLHASRQPQGAGLLLAGSFRLNTQTGHGSFDPETPDLGLIEQPQIQQTRLDFARMLETGQSLELQATRGGQEIRVTIEASSPAELPRPAAWTVIETAGLWPELPWLQEDNQHSPWPPSSIAAILASSGLEGSPLWAGNLLLIPPGSEELAAQALRLIDALSAAPSNSLLSASMGQDAALIPCVRGLPFGVRMTQVTTAMTGYRTDLATDAWIAEPQVQTLVNGSRIMGILGSGNSTLTWHQQAMTERGRIQAPELAYLGSLEWIAEGTRSGELHLDHQGSEVQVAASVPHAQLQAQIRDDETR